MKIFLNKNFNIYKTPSQKTEHKTSSVGNEKQSTNLLSPTGYYNNICFGQKQAADYKKHDVSFYTGCLLGGAIGDALGAPVEFTSFQDIFEKYGDAGIYDLNQAYRGKAFFTDDTQMTLFTADGLIKSALKRKDTKSAFQPDYKVLFESYKDWYKVQKGENVDKGWLSSLKGLHVSRGPGATCRTVLSGERLGTTKDKLNNQNGNGGIMRVAPVGLMYYKNPVLAFKIGAESAALTHGNPNAYLSSGFLAGLIANIIQGHSLEGSIKNTLKILDSYKDNEQLKSKILKAVKCYKEEIDSQWAIRELGNSCTGDGALAVSLYCTLANQNNFAKGIAMAVNHDGDSDTTGSITGNILGAYLGEDEISKYWIHKLELNEEISEVAEDLFWGIQDIYDADTKYPAK